MQPGLSGNPFLLRGKRGQKKIGNGGRKKLPKLFYLK